MADRSGAAFRLSGRPAWQYAAAFAVLFASGLVLFVGVRLYLTRNDLPACADASARRTLATIFRENGVAATATEDIRQVSRSDVEVACTAVATLADGGRLDVTWRMLREEGRPVARATWRARAAPAQ